MNTYVLFKKSRFLAYGLLFFAGACAAYAQMEEDNAFSLNTVLRIAYQANPKMVEAREEINASKGRWIQAEAPPDPELGLDVGGLKKHRKIEGDEDSRQIRKGHLDVLSVKQPLDPLGVRFLRGRIAHDEVKISKGDLQLVWAVVRKELTGLYAQILAEEKALETAQSNLNATRQFYTNVETKYQGGGALQSEVIRAKIEVSTAESEQLIAEKNLKVSRGEMNRALGRDIEADFRLIDSLAYEGLHYQYEEIKETALGKRADLLNEKVRLSSRKKGLWSAVLSAVFPRMAIGIERQTQDFENDTAVLIEASYPLWGFNFGKIREAKAEKRKQEVKLEDLKRQVKLEVYQAFLEADLADKIVLIKKRSVEESNELLKQITLQYQQGKVAFVIYLENMRTIKESRLGYLNALTDYKSKVAELERVIQATPAPEGIKL